MRYLKNWATKSLATILFDAMTHMLLLRANKWKLGDTAGEITNFLWYAEKISIIALQKMFRTVYKIYPPDTIKLLRSRSKFSLKP